MTSTSVFVGSGLSSPRGLAFDNLGNLYCANNGNNTISKITSDGASVTTFVNSGLNSPQCLAFDNLGNLYCSNSGNNTISKITSDGVCVPNFISSGLDSPQGLAFDSSGNLYCANFYNSTIRKITSAGAVSPFATGGGMYGPRGLAFDSLGNLYCANLYNSTISKITSDGASVTTFVNSGLNGPTDIAFDNSGNLYCANFYNSTICKITSAGAVSPFVNSGLNGPFGLAFDSVGNLYCANLWGNNITKTVMGQSTPTITNFPNQTFSNVYTFQYPFTYNLTQPQSNSSGAFSYSSSNTQTATVSGNTVTVLNAGNSTITATQAASGNYSAGSITSSLMVSNICFPAGTPITTDQGEIAIEKINPDIHTIRNKKIVDITKTVSTSDFLVCFEKHSLGNNIPSRKTVMTKDHEIFFKGKMIRAIDFMDKYENVHKVKYSGEPLYNVLLEKHDKMMVNNLICETLNPENPIAKVYGMLKSYSVEEQERLIKECNKITVNNNKFSSKQLEKINRHI